MPLSSGAQEEDLKAKMEVELEELFDNISNNPDNLNSNYRYAKLAEKLGKYYASIAAYERMLMADPSLDRVKLDLALTYMKMSNFVEAKRLFLEVKLKNPPEAVLKNINNMLARIEKGVKKHHLSANLTLGYTSDSNPSASPNSGAVDVFGVGIPIDDATGAASDEQKFVYANISHSYIMPSALKHSWNTEFGFYKSVQDNASALNTTVYSVKTGPVFNTKSKRFRLGVNATCSRVNLDEHAYLNTLGYEVFMDYILSQKAKIRTSYISEERKFKNTPTATTYEDRNGYTTAHKITLTSLLTAKDIFNTTFSTKREHTGVDYYTNRSVSAGLNYTHLFNKGVFINAGVLYRRTQYKDVDNFVNPNVKRKDNERTVTFGIGQNITDSLSCSMIYQNKDIRSNIQNYEYSNERVTASMNWRF
ncbi:MAG: tetratricopeptide (TPR) repeat protein [Alphaproteobacteria bacterium]|jgi:tetratricopeptide (TPR) repeat protein